MSLSKKNILFIVEGQTSEPNIIKKVNSLINLSDYQVISYKTSIYELIDEMSSDDDLDLLLLLKEKATANKRHIFDKKYSSVFLLFDFDPQYQKFDIDKLNKISECWNSSEEGKLLISYPMIESLRDLGSMPDSTFLKKEIDVSEISDYKKKVDSTSNYRNINSFNYETIISMICHHLVKFNYLISQRNEVPNKEEFYNLYTNETKTLIKLQYDNYLNGKMSVISMALFYLIELNEKKFFNTATRLFKLNPT